MRRILEVYRWMTLAAFFVSGALLALPVVVFFLPGYHATVLPGTGLAGLLALAVTFAASGFNVIAIAIYDQLRDATAEIGHARTELAYLREEVRNSE